MIDLEELGITKDELINRVVEKIADRMLEGSIHTDEYGDEYTGSTDFNRKLDKAIEKRIDVAINTLADEKVLPNVIEYVKKLTLDETNKWGESKGKPVTFIEYMVLRAEAYMTEPVNYEGKPRGKDNYHWSASGSRISHEVHKYLQYEISTAMKEIIKDANTTLAKGLQETCKIKMAEIAKGLKVKVEVK